MLAIARIIVYTSATHTLNKVLIATVILNPFRVHRLNFEIDSEIEIHKLDQKKYIHSDEEYFNVLKSGG